MYTCCLFLLKDLCTRMRTVIPPLACFAPLPVFPDPLWEEPGSGYKLYQLVDDSDIVGKEMKRGGEEGEVVEWRVRGLRAK